jgi:hypothetical protein
MSSTFADIRENREIIFVTAAAAVAGSIAYWLWRKPRFSSHIVSSHIDFLSSEIEISPVRHLAANDIDVPPAP